MKKYIIKNLSETKKLATKIASQLLDGSPRRSQKTKAGEVIGLSGNLGTGKTTFTQYLAKALGVTKTVNSPTFNIMKIYSIKSLPLAKEETKRGSLIHIDTYRMANPQELTDLGVEEYFNDPDTITVIEWADKVKKILPSKTIFIDIKLAKDGSRIFSVK